MALTMADYDVVDGGEPFEVHSGQVGEIRQLNVVDPDELSLGPKAVITFMVQNRSDAEVVLRVEVSGHQIFSRGILPQTLMSISTVFPNSHISRNKINETSSQTPLFFAASSVGGGFVVINSVVVWYQRSN